MRVQRIKHSNDIRFSNRLKSYIIQPNQLSPQCWKLRARKLFSPNSQRRRLCAKISLE
jgi:hypothetical protein